MTTLLLLRHSIPERGGSSPDPGLSAEGLQRAAAVFQNDAFRTVSLVWSSPSLRALQTAQLLGLPVRQDTRLAERRTGDTTGQDASFWKRQYEDPDFKNPDGESFREVSARMADCIHELLDSLPEGQNALVVSHAAAICSYLGGEGGPTPTDSLDEGGGWLVLGGVVGGCVCYKIEYPLFSPPLHQPQKTGFFFWRQERAPLLPPLHFLGPPTPLGNPHLQNTLIIIEKTPLSVNWKYKKPFPLCLTGRTGRAIFISNLKYIDSKENLWHRIDRIWAAGRSSPCFCSLMIPAVVAQVVNLLYNIVDRIYIGHIEGIGAAALTGVGLFAPILMLLNAFAMLIGAGGAPRTAIALGQGNKDDAEKIIGNSFTMLLFFAVVLTAGFYAGAPALLRLFGASDATLPYAVAYGRIYILGSVFVLLVMGMNPFITTQGFAKISMLTTVIGAVINIILDPILIFRPWLGRPGCSSGDGAQSGRGCLLDLEVPHRPQDHPQTPERKPQGGAEHHPAGAGAGHLVLRHALDGEPAFHQLQLQPRPLWRRHRRRRDDRHHQRVPAGTLPIQGICQGGQPVMSFNFGAGKKPRSRRRSASSSPFVSATPPCSGCL